MYDQNNIFAKILRTEIPAEIIHQGEYFIAFKDIAPQAQQHVLVIPRGEYRNFYDFTTKATDIKKIAFQKGIVETIDLLNLTHGYRLVTNHGENGGQLVDHYHVHILGGEKLKSGLN